MKLLTIDIETRPNLAYVWGLWDQNIGLNQIAENGEVISWAAKWADGDDVMFRSVFHNGKENMLSRMYELLSEADAVITYNGRKFDVPWLNAEFFRLGFTPPAPFQQIDLFVAVKRKFKLASYKLDYVCQYFGIGKKVQHEGFELWLKCLERDPDAWSTMRAYNMHDVEITEDLYRFMLPWIPAHPSCAAYECAAVCPACGSDDLEPQGHAYTRQGKFQRYRCRDCGKWSRSSKVERDEDGTLQRVDIVEVVT